MDINLTCTTNELMQQMFQSIQEHVILDSIVAKCNNVEVSSYYI